MYCCNVLCWFLSPCTVLQLGMATGTCHWHQGNKQAEAWLFFFACLHMHRCGCVDAVGWLCVGIASSMNDAYKLFKHMACLHTCTRPLPLSTHLSPPPAAGAVKKNCCGASTPRLCEQAVSPTNSPSPTSTNTPQITVKHIPPTASPPPTHL